MFSVIRHKKTWLWVRILQKYGSEWITQLIAFLLRIGGDISVAAQKNHMHATTKIILKCKDANEFK
jgi:hypothetical protein